MKAFFLLFCLALWVGSCSRIGFYDESGVDPSSQAPHRDYLSSSSCKENADPALCQNTEESDPLFRKGREEKTPGHLTEYFEIPHRDELEIVLVMDVSRSMDDNLTKTGQNMMALLSHIQHRRWRMTMITADHGDHTATGPLSNGYKVYPQQRWEDYQGMAPRFGKFMKLEKQGRVLNQFILRHDTPEYVQIFRDTLTRKKMGDCDKAPYCQGAHEQPLRSLQSAFLRYQRDPLHQKFFQPDTDTVAILITDEDERLNDSQNATSAEEVLKTFHQVFKGQRKRLFGFSISIQDQQCYRKERSWSGSSDYGRMVGRLADLSLSKASFPAHLRSAGNVSLCAKDYGQALRGLSEITRTATQSLTLEKIFYIPETVEIQLTPSQPQVSWHFYGRKLVFSDNILPGTEVKVSYRYELSQPSKKRRKP